MGCDFIESIAMRDGGYRSAIRILDGAHSFVESDRKTSFGQPTNGYKCKGHFLCVYGSFKCNFGLARPVWEFNVEISYSDGS